MGLLLSILVSCVGVVELLAIYGNVRRAVVQTQQRDGGSGDLDSVKGNYLRDLRRERDRLRREIARLQGNAGVQNSGVKEVQTQEALSVRDFDLPSIVNVSETPRNATDISAVNKPDVSKIQSNLEETPPVPIKDKHTQHVFPSYIDSSARTVINLSTPDEQHPIVITDTQQHSSNYEDDFHREASPYPTYDRLAPRNSLCSELLTDPISVSEVDEESFKRSEKAEDILKSNFDNPDYWGKSLRPERRSKSRSRSRTPEILLKDRLDFEERSRSKSPNPARDQEETVVLEKGFEEDIESITRCSLEDLDSKPQEEGIKRRKSRKGRSKDGKSKSTEEQEEARQQEIDDKGRDPSKEEKKEEVVRIQDEQSKKSKTQKGASEEEIRRSQFKDAEVKAQSEETRKHTFTKEIPKELSEKEDYFKQKILEERSKQETPEELSEKADYFKQKILEERSKQETSEGEETAQLVDTKYWKRSPSPFQKILDIYASSSSLDQENEESSAGSRVTIVELEEELDAEMLNSVDGINKKQKQTNEENKRQFKKKRNKRTRNVAPASEQSSFSDEGGNVVAVDENAKGGSAGMGFEEVQEAGPSRKPGEPFWVKQK